MGRLGRAAGTVKSEGIYVVNGAKGAYVGQPGDVTRRLGEHTATSALMRSMEIS